MLRLRPILTGLAALVLLFALPCNAQPQRGDVVYQNDFEDPDLQIPNSPTVRLDEGFGNSKGVRTDFHAAEGVGDATWRLPLNLTHLRGVKLKIEAQVKAQDVAKPAHPYNGVKVMLQVNSPGGIIYPQQNDVYGTFDWKSVRFIATVPTDVTEAWLILGLERTTGTAWFDNLKITVVAPPHLRPQTPPPGPVYTGHDVPRLRGTMISPGIQEADLRVLGGEWKANHLRWQLTWSPQPGGPANIDDLASYEQWIDHSLDHLDALLPVCRELGMEVLIDLHSLPGGQQNSVDRMFLDKKWQDEFLTVWQKIAKRYNGNPTIWGYDLANEPIETGGDMIEVPADLLPWQELATKASRLVRDIDAKHAIIIEPAPGGGPSGFTELDPIPVPGIVYSVHMYNPHEFTHQGVGDNAPGPVDYPGKIGGVMWDKERLRKALQPVRDFQLAYNVQIYVGEFSAIRWAPGDSAYNYLRDCIDIFEEYGWDWDYHAFREYDGWSVESGPVKEDARRLTQPTKREELLRSWFAKNVKASPEPAKH